MMCNLAHDRLDHIDDETRSARDASLTRCRCAELAAFYFVGRSYR